MKEDIPSTSAMAMLPKVDTLPRSQTKAPLLNRDSEACRCERGFDMCGHVVGALCGVRVEAIAFFYESIQPIL